MGWCLLTKLRKAMVSKRDWLATALSLMALSAAAETNPSLNTYGTPGLVELPSAYVLDDGDLAFSVSTTDTNLRNTITFQVFPKVYGSFRYSRIKNFNGAIGDRFDRSFDVHFQFLEESETLPAVAIGLRDFLGTGILAGEYVVATKQISPNLIVTGGLGWGRLAGENGFSNPLGVFGEDFNTRSGEGGATGFGGQLESSEWFRGDAAFFGGVEWNVSDNISLQLEYSPDTYPNETDRTGFQLDSQINAALKYRFETGFEVTAYAVGGNNLGVQVDYVLDPETPLVPGGRSAAPAAILPRQSLAAASWNVAGSDTLETTLRDRLAQEGLGLERVTIENGQATVYIRNERWDIEAQAAGRATRVLANTLAPSVETLNIVFQENGVPLSQITTQRSDLEDLQYDYDAAWRTRVRADITDANINGAAQSRLTYNLTPYAALSFFDPQAPIRIDVGPQLDLTYFAAPGLTFDARFRYPVAGNLGESIRESDSILPRVRSESFLYARESEFEINRLTAEYIWRPGPDLFARATGGYLEEQFGGVSTELLWFPTNSRYGVGAELNFVRQRDFDMLLGFQDYDVLTGHASLYYDLGNGFHTQIDAGRYLAGDWGGTLTVHREFENGVRVGGYFTLTDVPFDDFGEGSFDKGLEIEIPLSWFTGRPSRRALTQNVQPILRDGGARLRVENRLYDLVRDYRGAALDDGWGLYLR